MAARFRRKSLRCKGLRSSVQPARLFPIPVQQFTSRRAYTFLQYFTNATALMGQSYLGFVEPQSYGTRFHTLERRLKVVSIHSSILHDHAHNLVGIHGPIAHRIIVDQNQRSLVGNLTNANQFTGERFASTIDHTQPITNMVNHLFLSFFSTILPNFSSATTPLIGNHWIA